ncbi:MAG TPA: DUF2203 domain-containing protein [Gemmatimonadota bacterium]
MSSALGQGIRLFDVEEAERMLPLIRVIVKGMMDDHAERQALVDRLDGPPDEFTPREIRALRSEIDTLTEKLSEAASELEDLGVEFKGIDLGLVDFPTTVEGELAYLCWSYGEDRIGFWHLPDGGYAGRRPLERD